MRWALSLLLGAVGSYVACQPESTEAPVGVTPPEELEETMSGVRPRARHEEASGRAQQREQEDGAAPQRAAAATSPQKSEQNQEGNPSEPNAALPEDLVPHVPTEVPMPRDRNIRVAHSGPDANTAMVYLHGMCGNPKGADPWLDVATKRATVIVVRANVECPHRPGYKWPQAPQLIQSRIEAALEVAKEQRGGRLNTDEVTLIGYSQGSHRAERLAARYPGRYPYLVLGGPPTPAEPHHFDSVKRVAILGGELENTWHMEQGLEALQSADVSARFFVLPGAHHGSYGPQGQRIMAKVFDWLYTKPP